MYSKFLSLKKGAGGVAGVYTHKKHGGQSGYVAFPCCRRCLHTYKKHGGQSLLELPSWSIE